MGLTILHVGRGAALTQSRQRPGRPLTEHQRIAHIADSVELLSGQVRRLTKGIGVWNSACGSYKEGQDEMPNNKLCVCFRSFPVPPGRRSGHQTR